MRTGKGGFVTTWLFQAMTACRQGKRDEARLLLERVEAWHRKQNLRTWQPRQWWKALLAEAKELIAPPQ
jgi:hypothetical protein